MTDTIAAIATAPGEGGVSIVRISGDGAEDVLMRVFRPAKAGLERLPTHLMTYGRAVDGQETLDECMAVLMRAPRSYTREDVAELQLHGGGATARRVLEVCLREGARLAEPGEFTRRAFLNGRIDLSQAEAVMALIAAQGEQARIAAVRQLEGGASTFIRRAADSLYQAQAALAACLDYPEEISDEEALADLEPRLSALIRQLEDACDERSARILAEGLSVALCGRPNVGKSSLLNALLREDRAIVTDIPGTTRDVVSGEISLGGSLVRLTDTAGLRDTADPVERIGVERARRAVEHADVAVLVVDASAPLTQEDRDIAAALAGREALLALSKSDLPSAVTDEEARALLPQAQLLRLCALRDDTLLPLREALRARAAVSDRLPLTQPRHIHAARRAVEALREAQERLAEQALDLCSVDLQRAQAALGEITGDQADERLLDQVFSTFCVGK